MRHNQFEAINERLCYIRFSIPSYDLIIINCHAPTEEKEDRVKNAFYEDLERVYDTLPRHSGIICPIFKKGDMKK